MSHPIELKRNMYSRTKVNRMGYPRDSYKNYGYSIFHSMAKLACTFLFESRLVIKVWAEAISNYNWLRRRLLAQWINENITYTPMYNKRPDMSSLLRFAQPSHSFQYRSTRVKGKKFLPRTVYEHFVGMEIENTLYRIYLSSTFMDLFCIVFQYCRNFRKPKVQRNRTRTRLIKMQIYLSLSTANCNESQNNG